MAPKSMMGNSRYHFLKRPHERNGSNSPGSTDSKDWKFTFVLWSSIPKVQPQKKQKGKKTSRGKEVVQVDANISSTLVRKSELNILTKDFMYQEFMNQVLMTPTTLEANEDHLVEKL